MAKGHKLKTLKGDNTRPTADRVKESVFNIINDLLFEATVLDLFSGTGNLGIEALSRGATKAIFVDKSRECVDIINQNLVHTKLEGKATVILSDAMNFLQGRGREKSFYDVIFLDPPYLKNHIESILESIAKNEVLNKEGIVVVESDIKDNLPENILELSLYRSQKYGDTIVSFYKRLIE